MQSQLSEILFHFHIDQAAAHQQSMTNTLPLTKQISHEFTVVRNTMNRIWKIQEREISHIRNEFETNAALMGDFLQLFLQSPNQRELLEIIKKHVQQHETFKDGITIHRQLVQDQQRHLHENTQNQ